MPKQDVSEAAFHRRVVLALALEWRLAAAWLPERYRTALREPGFSLSTTTSLLGQWIAAPVREIRVAQRCVTGHPWFAVVDILKHEMAHQLADELLGANGEAPHGTLFHEACRLLGANPAASGSYPTLDEAILEEKRGNDGTILAKIRKLLALANSTNQHEAERAMAKAREWMARHNLEPLLQPNEHYVTLCLGRPALRHGLDVHALASFIRDFYFVRTMWIPMAVPEKGRIGRALEISGTPDNVRLAHYVFGFVNHVLAREWERYRRGRGLGRNGRRDFALGLIEGFRGLLRQQTEASPEIAALVRRGDPGLDRYVQTRHPRHRKTGVGRGVRVNTRLLRDGENTARRVGLRQGLHGADGNSSGPRALLGS